MNKRLIKNPTIANIASLLAMEARRDKSGMYSMYNQCHNVINELSNNERDRFFSLPRAAKLATYEKAHDTTIDAIFKMMRV